jgi:hypothetical protein
LPVASLAAREDPAKKAHIRQSFTALPCSLIEKDRRHWFAVRAEAGEDAKPHMPGLGQFPALPKAY